MFVILKAKENGVGLDLYIHSNQKIFVGKAVKWILYRAQMSN